MMECEQREALQDKIRRKCKKKKKKKKKKILAHMLFYYYHLSYWHLSLLLLLLLITMGLVYKCISAVETVSCCTQNMTPVFK